MKNLLLRGALLFCFLFIMSKTAFPQVDLYLDSINVYVNEYGKIGVYSLPDTISQLIRMSPLVGIGLGQVLDERTDVDIEDSTRLITDPVIGDYEIYGSYNNYYSGLPPNALVKTSIYCWQNQNSVIVKYTIINRESSPIDAIFGLEFIPELEGEYAGTDTVIYNMETKILSDHKTEAIGFKFLSEDITSLNTFMYYSDYGNDTTFWGWLTSGTIDTLFIIDPETPDVDDPVIIPAFKSKTLASGDSVIYYVAVGYGSDKYKMLYNVGLAQQKYNQITSVKKDLRKIPEGYSLNQNYPNPFNPNTKIEFQIPKSGNVLIKIYNTLGKEVATIINSEMSAGSYIADFNAQQLASGIYYYTIRSGSFSETRKMILLR